MMSGGGSGGSGERAYLKVVSPQQQPTKHHPRAARARASRRLISSRLMHLSTDNRYSTPGGLLPKGNNPSVNAALLSADTYGAVLGGSRLPQRGAALSEPSSCCVSPQAVFGFAAESTNPQHKRDEEAGACFARSHPRQAANHPAHPAARRRAVPARRRKGAQHLVRRQTGVRRSCCLFGRARRASVTVLVGEPAEYTERGGLSSNYIQWLRLLCPPSLLCRGCRQALLREEIA